MTCVFFMWGLSYGLLEVLNKHFQESMSISKAQSGLLQFSYFFAYFIVSRPAAVFNEKFGYKGGILLGLGLFAVGALLFIPASSSMSYPLFLVALFVLASGLGCLETAANPYATLLGDPRKAEKRLNMAQSFCSLGTAIGPLIGGILFFNDPISVSAPSQHDMVKRVYVCLAIVVMLIAFLISIATMPEARSAMRANNNPSNSLLSHRNFVGAIIAQFFSMAALVGVSVFFVNYATENWPGMTSQEAAWLLSVSIFLFMVGRFISTFVMEYVAPRTLLIGYAMAGVVLSIFVVSDFGKTSVIALCAVFFFMSIMFPTIFSLGIKGLKERTKEGSSILMMSVIGGGISPYVMGRIADNYSTSLAYVIPLLSFVAIFVCGLYFRNEEVN
ncbi:sugar MFS transporter [Burkholderia sp. L27(2015)]|uniref:sugar MFS transporter n=1 Tax=Burkholderia sp. L27(2015) TaxID=1641858 RepID=UPI00349E69B9